MALLNKDYTFEKDITDIGISTSLLIGNYPDMEKLITCAICFNILLYPVTCQECSIVICKRCLEKWLKSNSGCPSKCKVFNEGKVDKYALKFISALKLRCIFNSYCKKELNYDSFISHFNQCEYNPVICRKCSKKMFLKDINDHMKTCNNNTVNCPICNAQIKSADLSSHSALHSKKTPCKNCGLQIENELLKNHMNVCQGVFNGKDCRVCDKPLNNNHSEETCILKLKNENRTQKQELNAKQEEKDDLIKNFNDKIRVLNFTQDSLKNDNTDLKNSISKSGQQRNSNPYLTYTLLYFFS